MEQQVHTPFDPLINIAGAVDAGLSMGAVGIQDKRRQVAAKWLTDLLQALNDFHRRLLKMLEGHPALNDSTTPEDYQDYLKRLGSFEDRIYERDVKGELSSNLRKLRARLEVDFAWLKEMNRQTYDWLKDAAEAAY